MSVAVSAANTNDAVALKPLVRAIPAIKSRCGPRRRRPAKLHADKAYDHTALRTWLRDRAITVRIARKGIEASRRLGAAACLAEFIQDISSAHRSAGVGGDGKVVVVAHSMGGLVLRYATDSRFVPHELTPEVVPQVVTIGTPHLGAPLGGTVFAAAQERKFLLDEEKARPDNGRSAAHCLAVHTHGAPLADKCGPLPPYLPSGMALTQIAGDITVDRTAFGLRVYSVPLTGDGTVPVSSAHGYPTSGDDGRQPPGGTAPASQKGSCRVDFGLLWYLALARFPKETLLLDLRVLHDVRRGKQSAEVVFLAFVAGQTALCGHSPLPVFPPTVDAVAAVVGAVPAQPATDPNEVRFDGIGRYSLDTTAADLRAMGFTDEGNLYGGTDCVRYAKKGEQVTFSVEPATGRVLAIKTGGTQVPSFTQAGRIRVGSTLTEVRTAFRNETVDERLDYDFGQGTNGVIVTGDGGSIGLGLADVSSEDYASGRAAVDYVAGVGLPGHAPSRMEDGC